MATATPSSSSSTFHIAPRAQSPKPTSSNLRILGIFRVTTAERRDAVQGSMPKLKSFTTQSGFFELAVAAPSMKAALRAWGFAHDAFAQGFARRTDDPAIVAATQAAPGMVLKRTIGSKGAFKAEADLPQVKGRPAKKKAIPRKDDVARRKAQARLDAAQAAHEKQVAALRDERAALEDRIAAEEAAWLERRKKLERAVRQAG